MNDSNNDMPACPLDAVTARIRVENDWDEVVSFAFSQHQVSGAEPYVRVMETEVDLETLDEVLNVLPERSTVLRDTRDDDSFATLASVPGGHALIVGSAWASGPRISISAADAATADALRVEIERRLPEPPETDEGKAHIHTWFRSSHGPSYTCRDLEVPRWAGIARNYPEPVTSQLAQLMAVERPVDGGQLILWHGAPGTGKTTALRALIDAWRPWCTAQYVVDPEMAFADPSYLIDLITRNPRPGGKKKNGDKWKLIIAEDSDEFLRADARQSAGAALGRLLNLSDGILGQGSNTLVLLTTNEDIKELHPALIRPGRALAKTEFARFTATEANAWLDGAGLDDAETAKVGRVGGPVTLAELYERLGIVTRIGAPEAESPATGMYL
ncbi:MAG: ATP-binding protein [Promicromonosporaceae bacterium]|nr:ATP-binding protein [Promicromonosporaceae bacterium]